MIETSRQHLRDFHSKLAGRDPDTVTLAAHLRKVGVRIPIHPKSASKMEPGETLAIAKIRTIFRENGPVVLQSALRCIVVHGNAGELRAENVGAVARVIMQFPDLSCDMPRLIWAFHAVNFATLRKQAKAMGGTLEAALVPLIVQVVTDNFQKAAA